MKNGEHAVAERSSRNEVATGWPVAAHAAAGGCGAPRAAASEAACLPASAGGRREAPALDLSLGHIGTTPISGEIDFVSEGPFMVELDYREMVVTVSLDRESHCSRDVRRSSARKVEKLLSTAKKAGMRIVRESP